MRQVLSLRLLASCLFYSCRDKGERIDKEECHLLCALFCLSLSFIHLSSILFLALPVKIVFFLSLLAPSLSLLFSCSSLYDKNTRKEEQEGNGGPVLFTMDGASERGWLLARRPSPCFSKFFLSPYRLCSFPCSQTEKVNGFLKTREGAFFFIIEGKGKDKQGRDDR